MAPVAARRNRRYRKSASRGMFYLMMRPVAVGLALAAALACSACGEITAFCMSAGAPDGVTLVLTSTPTGYQCSWVRDSLPRAAPPNPRTSPSVSRRAGTAR